jgi:hypothetical protein
MYGACYSFSTVCAEPFGTNLARQNLSNPSEAFKIHPKRFAPYSTKGMFREQKIEVSEKIFGPDLISLALGAVRKTPTDSEKSQLPSRSSVLHKALRRKR